MLCAAVEVLQRIRNNGSRKTFIERVGTYIVIWTGGNTQFSTLFASVDVSGGTADFLSWHSSILFASSNRSATFQKLTAIFIMAHDFVMVWCWRSSLDFSSVLRYILLCKDCCDVIGEYAGSVISTVNPDVDEAICGHCHCSSCGDDSITRTELTPTTTWRTKYPMLQPLRLHLRYLPIENWVRLSQASSIDA